MKKSPGFTLIEVVVAVVVFALMITPAIGVLYAEGKLQRKYQEKSRAMLIAKSEIERWKAWPGDLKEFERPVVSNGRTWHVTLSVEPSEEALRIGRRIIRPEFITVSVVNENGNALAEFRVMREPYR